jgi:hypothetical protein
MEFLGFAVDRGLQLFVADAEIAHQAVVDHHPAAGGDCAHGEFLPVRHTELAHQENVQRCPQERRDLPPDGYAATRKTEHQQVVLAAIGRQLLSQDFAGFSAVPERAPRISTGEPAPSAHRDHFRYRGHIQRTTASVIWHRYWVDTQRTRGQSAGGSSRVGDLGHRFRRLSITDAMAHELGHG